MSIRMRKSSRMRIKPTIKTKPLNFTRAKMKKWINPWMEMTLSKNLSMRVKRKKNIDGERKG